jgi:ABC-type glutathione transport system ATPase component
VSLSLVAGETYGLVGESGCGKSTLVKLVAGLVASDAGRVLFDGQDRAALDAADLKALRKRVQLVFQDPGSSLSPHLDVGRILAEPLEVHTSLTARERRQEARRLLEKVGLDAADVDRYPHQFSGGQRQRIAIARALAPRPDVLICDEPLSALDVSVQAHILNLLRDLTDELGLTCLFVAHNLPAVRWISDRVGVMRSGRLVEEGPVDDVFARPQHEYTKALLAAVPDPGRRFPRRES